MNFLLTVEHTNNSFGSDCCDQTPKSLQGNYFGPTREQYNKSFWCNLLLSDAMTLGQLTID